MTAEFNFDGLVGPTHNYAGLAFGNLASISNAGSVSNPRQAALQGLQKMRLLMDLGIPQAVIPPQQRPNLNLLRTLGFSGSTEELLNSAFKYQPELLAACYSAACMWTANMATVSPSSNTADQKLNITPANLSYNLHRAQEASCNYKILRSIFSAPELFSIHAPLPAYRSLCDEGAANHSLLCNEYGSPGVELFVYGLNSTRFPARQTQLASSSIARTHGLEQKRTIFVQQNPAAIDAGVFHNDVICVSNKTLMLFHSEAFVDFAKIKQEITQQLPNFQFIEITEKQLSLAEAVSTYFFNSQLISLPNTDDHMALIMPLECKNSPAVLNIVQDLLTDNNNPIMRAEYVECRQSMLNGGGPACLRLRIVLTAQQQQAMHQEIILNPDLYSVLTKWVEKHYRDRLVASDFLDPSFVTEIERALDELSQILKLESIYPFQT